MNDHEIHDAPRSRMEPADLDGHTIEELSDYLDAGCQPPDPSIDGSPGCRLALDSLRRLRELSPQLIAADVAAEPAADENWVQSILTGITLEARAGRRIPLGVPTPTRDLAITEGAVRGLVRAAEDAVPGVLVGRCRFDGDVTIPGAAVRVEVEVIVTFGTSIREVAEQLRAEIAGRLAMHTTLNVVAVDILVRDLHPLSNPQGESS